MDGSDVGMRHVQMMTFVAEAPRPFGYLPQDTRKLGATAAKVSEQERRDMLAHRHSNLETVGSRTNSQAHRTPGKGPTPYKDVASREATQTSVADASEVAQHDDTATPDVPSPAKAPKESKPGVLNAAAREALASGAESIIAADSASQVSVVVGGIGGPLITQRDVRVARQFADFTPVISNQALNKTPHGTVRRNASRVFGT